ncbi:hypothetical protein ACOMHN_006284 [Nucella lapillus]
MPLQHLVLPLGLESTCLFNIWSLAWSLHASSTSGPWPGVYMPLQHLVLGLESTCLFNIWSFGVSTSHCWF